MYVIAGVSGHTGRVVAETLQGKGERIRVLVRDENKGAPWKGRGAEIAVANLDDPAALTRAFGGASGAYVLQPPNPITNDYFADSGKMIDAIGNAAVKAALPHLVLLSSVGAHIPKGTGPIAALYKAERRFEALGIGTTFVRASYFLENYGGVLPAAKNDGVLPSFLPAHFKHWVVTTTDIGRSSAQALLDGPRGQRIIELSGPEEVTPTDIARTLTELLGREIKVIEVPLSAVVPTFTSFGMSPHMGELYREMYAAFIPGTITWEGKAERVRGTVGVKEGLGAMLG
jgi:uncharacterized protein YbjT (DUF2867 family)